MTLVLALTLTLTVDPSALGMDACACVYTCMQSTHVRAQCVSTDRLELPGVELDRPTETKDLECMIKKHYGRRRMQAVAFPQFLHAVC